MEKFDDVSNKLSKKIIEINKLAQDHHENMDNIDTTISLSKNKLGYLTH